MGLADYIPSAGEETVGDLTIALRVPSRSEFDEIKEMMGSENGENGVQMREFMSRLVMMCARDPECLEQEEAQVSEQQAWGLLVQSGIEHETSALDSPLALAAMRACGSTGKAPTSTDEKSETSTTKSPSAAD